MRWRRRKTPGRPRRTDLDRDGTDHARLDLGRAGESAAATHLRGLGFTILAKNLRTRTGEVDLLARKGRLLVAVEVKTRTGHLAPELTVTETQLARLQRTLIRLAPGLRPRPRLLRVDVVAVRPLPADTMEVRHFPGAGFEPRARRGSGDR